MLAPTSMFAIQILCVLVASLISHTASLVTTYIMKHCFNVLPNIPSISVTVSFCIMLKMKLTTTANATATTDCYNVYDRGCWHMYIDTPGSVPSRASSSSYLLAEDRLFLIWLVWTSLQFCTDLCSSDRCWGKYNLVIPMTFYTC